MSAIALLMECSASWFSEDRYGLFGSGSEDPKVPFFDAPLVESSLSEVALTRGVLFDEKDPDLSEEVVYRLTDGTSFWLVGDPEMEVDILARVDSENSPLAYVSGQFSSGGVAYVCP